MRKIYKEFYWLLVCLFVFNFCLIAITPVLAQADDTDGGIKFYPQVGIPDTKYQPGEGIPVEPETFAEYLIAIYNWAIRAILVLAVIVIMIAGFQWMTAAGNASKIGQAKERIVSAFIGIALAIGSYAILSFISPSLVKFGGFGLESVIEEKELPGKCAEGQICLYEGWHTADCQCNNSVTVFHKKGGRLIFKSVFGPTKIKASSGDECGKVDIYAANDTPETIYTDCPSELTCVAQQKNQDGGYRYTEDFPLDCSKGKWVKYVPSDCLPLYCYDIVSQKECITANGRGEDICEWRDEDGDGDDECVWAD